MSVVLHVLLHVIVHQHIYVPSSVYQVGHVPEHRSYVAFIYIEITYCQYFMFADCVNILISAFLVKHLMVCDIHIANVIAHLNSSAIF